jgi:hypothetical protein
VLANGDGPTVLFRADIDALPVQEATGLPYASEVPGVMHACGHDLHLTAGLGAVALLAGSKDAWSGTYVALFQPAEETAEGACSMVADGLVDRVPTPDVALGQHVLAVPAAGEVATGSGPIGQYVVLAIIAYCLFGLGLAFYATPSTDAALSNLPQDKAGSGAGTYKMASSLGSVIGVAVSLAVSLRQAGMFALAVNVIFVLLAIVSITVTVSKGGGSRDLGKAAASPAPEPQLPPDEENAALIARLSQLSLSELRQIEK